jgi:hypothetical protein
MATTLYEYYWEKLYTDAKERILEIEKELNALSERKEILQKILVRTQRERDEAEKKLINKPEEDTLPSRCCGPLL